MYCRVCGYRNHNDKGKCKNCGFDLEFQVLPMEEQRKGLQHKLPQAGERKIPHLNSGVKNPLGVVGGIIGVLGLAITLFIVNSMDRPERISENGNHEFVDTVSVQLPQDSLPVIIGSDIVYVFDTSGTSATPRTNINLSLIPDGTTVSFLGTRGLSIKPTVNFLLQKMASRDFNILCIDRLCCWTDSTETAFSSVSLVRPPMATSDTTIVQPVSVRFLFTEEWIRGMVEEFSIDFIEPVTGFVYNESKFSIVFDKVNRSLDRRDIGERSVQVTILFPDDSNLGSAIDILTAISPAIDSLGYDSFIIKYAIIED